VCRDFQNGRCFRGSCRFYHGATDDVAVAQMAGQVLGYHGGHAGMHPVHPVHALQRVMSLPAGGLPPFVAAGGRGRSFDAGSALAQDPGIAAFLGSAQAIPGWPGDSAAAAALALAATQTSATSRRSSRSRARSSRGSNSNSNNSSSSSISSIGWARTPTSRRWR
jgi:hypothetical protein